MATVLLFGLGAVGATHAYILQRGGASVTVCARSNYEVVANKGLDFRSEKYGDQPALKFARVVKAPSDPALKDVKFDFVVCCNKAIQAKPPIEEQIAPAVTPGHTTIVIIQNGVGNGDPFLARFPDNVVLSAVTWVNASQVDTGVVVHKAREKMQIGVEWAKKLERRDQEQKLQEFVSLLDKGESEYEVVPDIQQWRWKKTIWNCCWNSLTAMTLCNTADYLSSSESAPIIARAIVNEMALIARTLGLEIEDDYLESLLTRKDLTEGGIISSMYSDAKAERPMEVEVILSSPLRIAKQLGLQTPVLETCTAIPLGDECSVRATTAKAVVEESIILSTSSHCI